MLLWFFCLTEGANYVVTVVLDLIFSSFNELLFFYSEFTGFKKLFALVFIVEDACSLPDKLRELLFETLLLSCYSS